MIMCTLYIASMLRYTKGIHSNFCEKKQKLKKIAKFHISSILFSTHLTKQINQNIGIRHETLLNQYLGCK